MKSDNLKNIATEKKIHDIGAITF